MASSPTSRAGVNDIPAKHAIGRERLLSLADVCDITGWCPATASLFLAESGRKLKLHGHVYILESSLFAYLHELEEANLNA